RQMGIQLGDQLFPFQGHRASSRSKFLKPTMDYPTSRRIGRSSARKTPPPSPAAARGPIIPPIMAKTPSPDQNQFANKAQAWSARFSEPVSELVKRYTASVDFDKRL